LSRRVLALIVSAAGCLSLTPDNGSYVCRTTGQPCDNGYFCASDNRCYANGTDLAAPSSDLMQSDLALDLNGGGDGADAKAGVSATRSTIDLAPAAPLANGQSQLTITVTVRDDAGTPLPGLTVTLSSTGTGNVLTQPAGPTAQDGSVVGAMTSTVAETKTVSAIVGGVTLTKDVSFATPVASEIFFSIQPPNAGPGQILSPSVRVTVRDTDMIGLPGASVALTLANNTSGATLSGGTTATTDGSGVAVFSTLQVDVAQNGYRLIATAGAQMATSATFNIVAGLPNAPTGVMANATNSTITVTWTAVAGATGYNVLRSTSSGAEVLLAAGTNVQTTTFTDANLLRGTYYYEVQTINGVGAGASSLEVNAFASRELCVSNFNTNTISVLPAQVNTSVSPLRSLANTVSTPYAAVGDTVNNEIYVANFVANSVTVYPRTGTSTTAPTRSITTGLNRPAALAIDTTNNELWVVNSSTPSLAVYDRSALTLKRTITGNMTALSGPQGIALDLGHDEVFAVNFTTNSVVIYNRTDANNVAPKRTPISGTHAQISSSSAIAYDAAHDAILVASSAGSVTSYPRTTTAGNMTYPTWWLAGGSTGLAGPTGLVVDPLAGAGGEILVINGNGGGSSTVTAYPAVHTCGTSPCTTSTDDAPTRTINSASLNGSQGGSLCN
jgi:hypothetical protein